MSGPFTFPQSPVDLVIFDCDGVLVDSERLSIRVDQEIFERYGLSLSLDEIAERFIGTSLATITAALEEHRGAPVPPQFAADMHELHTEVFERELEAVPGIHETLSALALPRCVASSSTPERIAHSLALTGVDQFFEPDRIFSATMVERGKPAPDLFLFAADSLGVSPERCLVVEDSRFGARAAKAAGMRCLGFVGGLTPAGVLRAEGAFEFSSMAELPALVTRAAGSGGC